MSSLQVDSISSMGGGHVDGAGLVVQYVETSDSDVANHISITSTTYVSTGITVSITPKFIGSKVCVDYTGSVAYAPDGTAMDVTLYKDGVRTMGAYGIGYLEGKMYSPLVGQYTFTTTSLSTVVFTVYAKTNTGSVIPAHNKSSYTFSATEYAQ